MTFVETTSTAVTSPTKERSSTIVQEGPNTEMRVSSNFSSDETNLKLKTSTHVVVDEDTEEEDKGTDEYLMPHSN